MLHIHVIDELRTGGAQALLITMLREAVKYPSIEHRVVCLFGDGELSEEIRALGVAVHILDLRPYLRRRRFLGAASQLQALFTEFHPDLVEAHLTWSRLLGLFAAWRAGVPLRIGFEQGDLYLNSWKFRVANFVSQWFAHRIVVCSEALARWTRHTHGTSRSKLLVMHNCIDPTRFSKEGPEAADIDFSADTIVFCAVGTLGRGVNKRVDIMIRALALARSAEASIALVICGDGEQREELQELAQSLGVAPHVKLLGTRSDVAQVLRACDAFCHAAPFEPFGIVLIEAMAMGLPVVAPNSGGVREIIEPGVNGIVYQALDAGALSNEMVKLANQPELRESLGAVGCQTVQDRFSSRQYLFTLYQSYGISCGGDRAAVGASA